MVNPLFAPSVSSVSCVSLDQMDFFPFLPLLFALISCNPENKSGPNSTHHHHDYCVLGAGPAGVQMGYFLEKSGRDYIILERNTGPGSFFNVYVAFHFW